MGNLLDLMGRSAEAHAAFARSIELATAPDAKAQQERAMAMSYAFAGDCAGTVKYEQMVIAYWTTREKEDPANAFYQEGEMADEAARVCIDNGGLDAAAKWYQAGHDYGLRQPEITPVLRDLWEFRWEHAQARIAARRGNKAEADQHVAAAKAILDKDDQLAHGGGRGENQAQFLTLSHGLRGALHRRLQNGARRATEGQPGRSVLPMPAGHDLRKAGPRKTRRWIVIARPPRRRRTIRRRHLRAVRAQEIGGIRR